MDGWGAEPGSASSTQSLVEQVNKLQEELDSMRKRYNELKEAKDRAALRYKDDYRKWKYFKQWFNEDLERDEEVRRTLKKDEWRAYNKASMLGKRKRFEMLGLRLDNCSEEESEKENSRGGTGTVVSKPFLTQHHRLETSAQEFTKRRYQGRCVKDTEK